MLIKMLTIVDDGILADLKLLLVGGQEAWEQIVNKIIIGPSPLILLDSIDIIHSFPFDGLHALFESTGIGGSDPVRK